MQDKGFMRAMFVIVGVFCVVAFILKITLTPSQKEEPAQENAEVQTVEDAGTESERVKDNNVYLFEEARFADEVFFTVKQMEIVEEPSFALLLTIDVEQRNGLYVNRIDVTSDMFTIKTTNNAANMAVGALYSSVVQAGIEAGIGAIFGDMDGAIEAFLSVVGNYIDYIPDIVEEALSSFEIKASNGQFDTFRPREIEGVTEITVRFDFTEEQLRTDKMLILEINDGKENSGHRKSRIFLIPRPRAIAA